MSNPVDTAREDLAFMRSIVEGGSSFARGFGRAYFLGGVCYGGQMILHAGQALNLIPPQPLVNLAIGLGPTVVFLVLLSILLWRDRRQLSPGHVPKTVGSVFAAVGLANISLIAVIGSVAWREHSLTIWLIYPCAVFVLQGAAWFVVYGLRQKPVMLAIALGWIASGVAMALVIDQHGWFMLIVGVAMLALMVLPGWAMMRNAQSLA
jgi:hypothetical protein